VSNANVVRVVLLDANPYLALNKNKIKIVYLLRCRVTDAIVLKTPVDNNTMGAIITFPE
jgi:hypothetical protein